MKKVPISELKSGMRLARDVHLDDGRLLLLAGFIIKPRYIEKLGYFNIPYVFVDDTEDSELKEISEDRIYSEAYNTMRSVLSNVRNGKDLDVPAVKDTVSNIVRKIMNNEMVMMQVTGIHDIDSYTFLHCVDVCIYSVIIGKSMNYSVDELIELGMGAILHDIGKCRVPIEILTKPGRLTLKEFFLMKLHTFYGKEIIYNTPGLNNRIANIALHHHEKWDGTGYPLRLRGNEIDRHTRIVTVSDIYDALTANRVYKKRVLPHKAAEYIIGNSSILFDPQVVKSFIKSIAIYPENTMVRLHTGEIGLVMELNKNFSLRPKVKVIARKDGSPLPIPYVLDLMEHRNIFIAEILD